ncbi:hypothetical protein PM082_023052 [Marasmius tenuissimus]|nr:hypothetical protein PM082_023052 [Marasmius tenuissimus]
MITRIDERDPQLVFTPIDAWSPGGKKPEYMETVMGTTTAGARVSFNFTGTGVEMFGTISNNSSAPTVTNTFTIDGGSPVQRSQKPVLAFNSQYNAKLFSVRGLKDGVHNLVMEVLVEDSETWIDYLEVDASTESSASLPSGVPASPTQQTTSSGTGPLAPTLSGTHASGGLSRAAVAGIAIGGMTGVFLMLLLIGWGLRRRWQRLKGKGCETETETAQLNHTNGSLAPRRSTDMLLNSQVRPFLLFASTVKNSRNKAEQPPSSDGPSRPIGDCGPGYPEPSIPSLDDPPPSYASQPS